MIDDDEYEFGPDPEVGFDWWSLLGWIAAIGIIGGLLYGCVQVQTHQKERLAAMPPKERAIETHNVRLYFEVDGCKVYAFDGANGHQSHFATCPGIIGTTDRSGKTTIPSEVQTVAP